VRVFDVKPVFQKCYKCSLERNDELQNSEVDLEIFGHSIYSNDFAERQQWTWW